MKLPNPFRRRRSPAPRQRPAPSSTTRLNGERELRGHHAIVHRLATVPTADGVLLASGDTEGGVLLWDGRSGEPLAGPVTVDGVGLLDMAAVDLGADGWALVCAGPGGVTLWDPHRIGQPGHLPRRLADGRASALAVVPGEPPLIVISGDTRVSVVDAASGEEVFGHPQQPLAQADRAERVHRLAGVRFDEETAGFAAALFGGELELWAPAEDTWRPTRLPLAEHGRGVLTAYDTWLATTASRGVEVWDLRTGHRTSRGELDTPFEALAPVRLGQRTVIAAAFREHRECGVQLWDPREPDALSEVFNRHGPAFGDPAFGSATINAVTGVACPDGTTRVASAGNDDCVLLSVPLEEHDLVPGQRPGPKPPQRGTGNFASVRTPGGATVGLWFASTEQAHDRGLIEAILFREDLVHLLGAEHRVVPNTYDDQGGSFVMFGHESAPGEAGHG